MSITKAMRAERALQYIEREIQHEKETMEKLDGINIHEIIILRNKKQMYLAEIEQIARNLRADWIDQKGVKTWESGTHGEQASANENTAAQIGTRC